MDIYWLHLPTDIKPHMQEIIVLAKEGKIRHVGVSNFNLEEGMLVDPRVKTKGSIMKLIFNRQKRKMRALYQSMIQISERHAITVSQVAVAFCAAKGIVPLCGCRKPKQVEERFIITAVLDFQN